MQQDININNLQPVLMDSSRVLERDSLLTDCETDKLRSKIGQLLWVARQSRPDIMFDACILASTLKHGTVQTMHEANKVVKKLKSEHVTLKFKNLGDEFKYLGVLFVSEGTMEHEIGRRI